MNKSHDALSSFMFCLNKSLVSRGKPGNLFQVIEFRAPFEVQPLFHFFTNMPEYIGPNNEMWEKVKVIN